MEEKPWLYHCLNKHIYTYTHSHTHTHMHRHAQNMHTIHTYYLITHTHLVIGFSLVNDILYFYHMFPMREILVKWLSLTIILTILTIFNLYWEKLIYCIVTSAHLVDGLSLVSNMLYYFLSNEIFKLFFDPGFFTKIRIQTKRQILKLILNRGMQ